MGLDPEGLTVAHVVRGNDQAPRLMHCAFAPATGADARLSALKQTVKRLGTGRVPCVSALEPGSYSLLQVEAPDVDAQELRAAMRWRIKDLIDFHIDDAVIDVFDMPATTARGRQRMMHVVVARAAVVRERVELLDAAGLSIEAIDIAELALRNVAALLPEDAEGVALLHLHNDSGLVTLTRQGTLYLSRRIGAGGGPARARPEDLFDIVTLELQRSLDYYESHCDQPPIRSVVVMADSEVAAGLAAQLGANLAVKARVLDLGSALQTDTPLAAGLQAQALVTVGAALRTVERVL